MADSSKIKWTDATWNPVRSCTKVSAGCKHCYAETFAERWRGVKGHPFEFGFDLRLADCHTYQILTKRPKRMEDLGTFDLNGIDWVIVGGESGPGARPLEEDWAISIQDQCSAAKVPFFFKHSSPSVSSCSKSSR